MSLPLPGYGVQKNLYFDGTTAGCVEIATDIVLEWDRLSHVDQENVIYVAGEVGGSLPAAGAGDVVIPTTGMTFASMYGFAMRSVLSKPPVPKGYNDSTTVYYDGSSWKRVVDDAVLV